MIKRIVSVIVSVLVLLCLTLCTKTIYVPVERKTVETIEKHDTIIQTRIEREVVEVLAADTVAHAETTLTKAEASWRQNRLHLRVENKDTVIPIRTNVVYRTKICSIPQPYKVEVVKKVAVTKWYDKIFRTIGGGVIVVTVLLVLLKVRKHVI